MNKIIPIVMITDNNYIMPTSVAMTSVLVNKYNDTKVIFHIFMAECYPESKEWFDKFSVQFDCEVNIINVDMDKYKDINQLKHVSIAALFKFEISDRMREYDKVLYLDGDLIVRRDLWELFNVDVSNVYAAGVKDLESIIEDKGRLNTGVVLFNCKKIREENLLPVFIQTRKSLGDKNSMDQQTFNIVFKKNYNYLDIKYNCVPGKLYENGIVQYGVVRINKVYKTNYSSINQIYDEAIIVHYATSAKPWVYTYIPEAKEWYSYYLQSPFKDEPFKLMGRLEFRVKKYILIIKENGIVGVVKEIVSSLKKRNNKKVKDSNRIDQEWG